MTGMKRNKPPLVCFDLGGVIVRIFRSWTEACATTGLDMRVNLAEEPWKSRRKPLLQDYMTGRLTEDEWIEGTYRAIDQHYSPEEIQSVHRAWIVEEYDGVGAVVDRIHAAGFPTACLSNTNPAHWTALAPEDGSLPPGESPPFPTVLKLQQRYASHLMGLAKPDPAIYRMFEEATGFRGHEIIFFDDLFENVVAARDFGWQAVSIDHTGDTAAQITAFLEEAHLL